MSTNQLRHPIQVMVTDDSAVQLELFHRLINRMPDMLCNQVISSGTRALDVLENYTPDVLLISHMQGNPRMTGIELLQAVQEQHPDLPVIFYAGPHTEEKQAALEHGASTVLGMPLQLPKIVQAVRQAVGASV